MNTKPLYFIVFLLFALVIYLYMNYSREVVIKEVPVAYYGYDYWPNLGWYGPNRGWYGPNRGYWSREYHDRPRPEPRLEPRPHSPRPAPGPGPVPPTPGPAGPQPSPAGSTHR
jgi:hypothetical protein